MIKFDVGGGAGFLAAEEVLAVARPYLGTMHSGPSDWDPVGSRSDLFANFSDEADHVDPGDPWQFTNFLVDR